MTETLTPNKIKSLILTHTLLGEAGVAICLRILDEHQPETPPEGHQWVSGGSLPRCTGCATGDPFNDALWPCSTLDAIIETLEAS
jgi:hypothetical protein